jgi:hypothetical protein
MYFTGTNGPYCQHVSQSMVHDSMSVHGLINAGLIIIFNTILQLTLQKNFLYTQPLFYAVLYERPLAMDATS